MTTDEPWDVLWTDAHVATMREGGDEWGAVRDGALAVRDGRIAWIGSRSALGDTAGTAREIRSAAGGWITPGLIDCHTHLVYAGNRAREFQRRLGGASYAEIAREGGGILSTVRATRAASEEELEEEATRRLDRLLEQGVTTVEIKSGYGLEAETELRMLRVARRLAGIRPVDVQTTLLAAHAVPPEYVGRREAYVDLVVEEILPGALEEGLVDAVDAFLEEIAFDAADVGRVFQAATERGLPVRLHADQLSDGGGAALAAAHGARSADHLEHASREGVEAMAQAGTVAVLLPGAFYFLREERAPPVAAFREAGVAMAVATDANPGSSPTTSPTLMMNMACTLWGLTPSEALAGFTRVAARALGMEEDRGTLEVGKVADFAVWEIESPAELAYWVGETRPRRVVKGGEPAA